MTDDRGRGPTVPSARETTWFDPPPGQWHRSLSGRDAARVTVSHVPPAVACCGLAPCTIPHDKAMYNHTRQGSVARNHNSNDGGCVTGTRCTKEQARLMRLSPLSCTISFFFFLIFAILIVSKAISFWQAKFLFLIMSKLRSVYRLELTVPVGWALNTNN